MTVRPSHARRRKVRPDANPFGQHAQSVRPRRIAYVVSRFPTTTETFVLRELDAVAKHPEVEADLYSLFPAPPGAVHPRARPWIEQARPPGAASALMQLAYWAVKRPVRTCSSIALICRDYARRPLVLARALATLPVAAAHARTIQLRETDHVHAHFATYSALAAWLSKRWCGVPYSFTVHAHDLYVHTLGLRRRISDAAFVATISRFNRDQLTRLAPEGVVVRIVRCGVDLALYRFRPRVPRQREVRALCVGALREKKGHRILFEALASKKELQRVRLDLVGDGRLRGDLEQLALKLGIAPRVVFHGSMAEDEVARMLGRSDLFVLPSVVQRDGDTEGLPVALIEAMAAGVPVIASRLTGVPELVRDLETGLLVEPGDVAGLAHALCRTLAEPDAAISRVMRARKVVEREYELGINVRELLSLFEVSSPGALAAADVRAKLADYSAPVWAATPPAAGSISM